MIDTPLVVVVEGDPAPKGSLRCVGRPGGRHVLIEDNKRTGPWRATLTAGVDHLTTADPGQPVRVDVTFTVARPKSVRRLWPVTRSSYDLDKLVRLALDALQDAKVLPDDAQVVELRARKTYPTPDLPDALPHPGALLRIYPLE